MSNPLQLINLQELAAVTSGSPEIAIAIIDGPIDTTHPAFDGTNLQAAAQPGCQSVTSLACYHGTFVAGILGAQRSSEAPAICPDCSFFLRPIFCEEIGSQACPEVTPQDLADALQEALGAGVKIINLSLGLTAPRLLKTPELQTLFAEAANQGTLIVAAAGNLKQIGPIPLFNHPWVIPVAACDELGHLAEGSNIGLSVGRRGLLAPGKSILSTTSGGGYSRMSGTSVAVPFVTGTLALLWSQFPHLSGAQLRRAILNSSGSRRSIKPPLLNAASSWRSLLQSHDSRLMGANYPSSRRIPYHG